MYQLVRGGRFAIAVVRYPAQEVLCLVRGDVAIDVLFVVVNKCLRGRGPCCVSGCGAGDDSYGGGFSFLWCVVFYRTCLLVPSATVVRMAIDEMRTAALDGGDDVLRGRGGSVIDEVE